MYLELPSHTRHVIKDLYTVWLPPIPQRQTIDGWELKKEDQYWRRKPIPAFYEERRGHEREIQAKEWEMVMNGDIVAVRHFDSVLEAWRREEWRRRFYGHWFMNNGKPTYLTGSHYMYLQWSKLDSQENDGYPTFYVPQLDRFYFRQLAYEDPFCLGYIMVGPRGYGKTSEEVATILDMITRPPGNRHAALQSKTKDDAKDVIFKEKMVPMFNAYPEFFKPQYSHGSDPESKFVFKMPTVRGSEKLRGLKAVNLSSFELGNTVKFYSAKEKALDGKTLTEAFNDEVGKTDPKKEADVHVRTSVNVKCVFRNDKKVGLLRLTTTVEEMEKGGDQCFEVWKDSDPKNRDLNGYTVSKLYRLFIPATDAKTRYADRHGVIDTAKAHTDIMNERKPIKNDPYKLSMSMRKSPLTEEEAFIRDQSVSMFNVFPITKRIQELQYMKTLPGRPGRLEWVNEVDGDVMFVDDPQGKFMLWHPPKDANESRKFANACMYRMGTDLKGNPMKEWLPCNDDVYGAGCDPIKFIRTADPRASKFAAHGFLKFDPLIDSQEKPTEDWKTHDFAWRYWARSEDPDDDYENIIKALRFWGHSLMPESNINDFNKHLQMRGYGAFRIARRDFDPTVLTQKNTGVGSSEGVQTVPEVVNAYVKKLKQYLVRHVHRCNDLPLLKQLLVFDPENATPYDLVISAGYTLLSLEKRDDENLRKQLNKAVENVFTKYDISGHRSREVGVQRGYEGDDSDLIARAIHQGLNQN